MTANELYHAYIAHQSEWRNDSYHTNRYAAAFIMQNSGRGNWIYCTQWSSGSCLFRSSVFEHTCIVRTDGTIIN